jgi:ABC-type glycerol-3-phosphate transport system substrate-binding protein
MTVTRILLLAVLTSTAVLGAGPGAPAAAFDGEQQLYEAPKKEKELTWYTGHYDSETAAALCGGFEKKYPGHLRKSPL